MWPLTAFSVARGSIQKKNLQIKNLLKSVWSYICFIELLAPMGKVNLPKNNVCVKLLFLFYLFYDQIRTYGPSLTLRWGTWLYNLGVFSVSWRSLSEQDIWRSELKYHQINLSTYKLNTTFWKWPSSQINCPIPAMGHFNYCETSVTSFNKNVSYYTNGIRDCKEILGISQHR